VNIDLRPNTVVLRDRRRPEEMTVPELRQRIRVYRDIENANDYARYSAEERIYWRDQLRYDRDFLRRQLIEERRQRELNLERTREREIVIDVRPESNFDYEEDVFAAEADDEEIRDVLVKAPSVRPTRRYQVEEVANSPELRRSIPRVEVDTIRFGFGESIVREEEIDKLDKIGTVIEQILRRYPDEVFLIEGHTDAVGSDQFNIGLSRARADAVKQALVTYYNIPSQSVKTVGLGERFLKVPSLEAEAENRRVSIGRITAYVSSNQ
jgi:outer membrane protein OmpA-like peptidoglycan-associated protein